jgi:DNA polymerase bacteriophage-type
MGIRFKKFKSCTRKVPFQSQAAAEIHIIRQNEPVIWKTYKCPYCHHWHIAHRNDEKDARHMEEVTLDFETASAADLKESGAWRYAEDITTEILCLYYEVNGTIKRWLPGENIDGLKYMAENVNFTFIAHNAGFEKAIWRNIMVPLYGLPDVPNSRWDDTMAACAMRAIPLDLDRAVTVLRLVNRKDKQESRFTKALSNPDRKGYYNRTKDALERVYAYCEQDVLAERDLRRRLGPLPPGERNIWLLDQRINERGVLLDAAFVEKAQQVIDLTTHPHVEEFREITGGITPTQIAKFTDWINAQGVYMDSLNREAVAAMLGGDIDSDEEVEVNPEAVHLPDNVRRALYIRSLIGSASIKKLARMATCVGLDGRARGLLQYHGASPGRWAGRLLQPQNFPRGTLTNNKGDKFEPEQLVSAIMTGDPRMVEMMVGPPMESVISALRHAIIAAPGRTLLSGDFAGVEARMVLALSGQHDKTELMASGKDVYCDMAQEIYKRPIDKKKDPEERQTGKNSVLGLGFGMGWKKFKMKYGQKLSEEFCQQIVKTYREDWAPCVQKLWWSLEEAALETVKTGHAHEAYGVLYERNDQWLTARLPSGRRIWYFNPTETRKAMPWDDTDIRIVWTYQAMKTGQWRTIDAFGGLLCENVIQGLARDLMVEAMFKLEKNGFPIILTVHDEIVCEPLAKDADEKAFEQIMADIPAWAKKIQMPVAVETWSGLRYKK